MEHSSDLIFGLHPVEEALRSSVQIDKILIARQEKGQPSVRTGSLDEIKENARKKSVAINYVPVDKLNRITRKNHQGVVAFISPISFQSIEQLLPQLMEKKEAPLLLVLDGITDVRNFGSIVRTAECMGVDAVVMPARNASPINADAVKTSAGAVFNIPICKEKHFGSILQFIQESGVRLLACSEKALIPMYTARLTGPLAVIMGDEGVGIHEKTLERVDQHIGIPMKGKTSSLNVSVATGMLLSECNRQRLSE
ncbi:23S rRNA (guanosine(2251)-2'-O)-methyltransferase RlmB [bacterium SCSIO 12741]|nr:23S rRNA (guanosine(2251)-2'-O)-methyltransferase RlmB [bacterium SCSIO 12741]